MNEPSTLLGRDGDTFRMATGALWLDFVYTGGEGGRAKWEQFHSPGDLARWARDSRLALTARMPARIDVSESALAAARQLREVLWRAANTLADGEALGAADCRAINEAAAAPDPVPQLTASGAAWRGPLSGEQLLAAVARDVMATVRGGDAQRLRRCAADNCPLMFIDTSRPGSRRWCAMARCGNRTKVRTHRTHLQEEDR